MNNFENPKTPETISTPERHIEIKPAVENSNDKLKESLELSPRDIEARAETAKREAEKNAISIESKTNNQEKKITPQPAFRNKINKKILNDSYKKTMKTVQSELSPIDRLFSKITHNPVIDEVSSVVGKTIARPNAMLSGAFAAFILTLVTYTIAKKNGYVLSGFETILAFIIGWVIGNIYDYFRLLITGKKD